MHDQPNAQYIRNGVRICASAALLLGTASGLLAAPSGSIAPLTVEPNASFRGQPAVKVTVSRLGINGLKGQSIRVQLVFQQNGRILHIYKKNRTDKLAHDRAVYATALTYRIRHAFLKQKGGDLTKPFEAWFMAKTIAGDKLISGTYTKARFQISGAGAPEAPSGSDESKLSQLLGSDNLVDGIDKAYGDDIKGHINSATAGVYGARAGAILEPAMDGLYDSLKDDLVKGLVEKGEINRKIFEDVGNAVIGKYKEKLKERAVGPLYDYVKKNAFSRSCAAVKSKLGAKARGAGISQAALTKLSAKIDEGCEKAWEKSKEWFEKQVKQFVEKHWATLRKKMLDKLNRNYNSIKQTAEKKAGGKKQEERKAANSYVYTDKVISIQLENYKGYHIPATDKSKIWLGGQARVVFKAGRSQAIMQCTVYVLRKKSGPAYTNEPTQIRHGKDCRPSLNFGYFQVDLQSFEHIDVNADRDVTFHMKSGRIQINLGNTQFVAQVNPRRGAIWGYRSDTGCINVTRTTGDYRTSNVQWKDQQWVLFDRGFETRNPTVKWTRSGCDSFRHTFGKF